MSDNFSEVNQDFSEQNLIGQGYFFNPSCGNLKIKEVIDEIFSYIKEKPEKFYDIIVGCDSSSGESPNFPLAIVILRVGEGGRFFLKKISYDNRKFFNWKTRILEEVFLSCQLALFLREQLDKTIKDDLTPLNYQFRYIHADVGENGSTKDMIKEVVGLIRGNGFEPRIKPESYAASSVADRYS
ncbi:MAG: ribonuclease H-like YkuK family protein [Patescibacteria group bacterium]